MLNQLDLCVSAVVAICLIGVLVMLLRLFNAAMGWDEDEKHEQECDE